MLSERKDRGQYRLASKRAFTPSFLKPLETAPPTRSWWITTNGFRSFGYVEFLREYGPHFTINRMLTFDSVKLRLDREQPLTFLEFNYMLMQAADFLELNAPLRLRACRWAGRTSGEIS